MVSYQDLGFFGYSQVLLVALLLYVIFFSLLKKISLFSDDKVNSLVSLVMVLLVSFSGVVTYVVSYAISWFAIFFFVIFVVILVMMFLGASFDEVKGFLNPKIVGGILGVFFVIILFKGFFGLNNVYDITEPQENPYEVDTNFNSGVNDITGGVEVETSIDFDVSDDLLAIVGFLLIIGFFVFLMGRS